ncbi:MAG: response regulator transcription factor [Chitinophagaceae bacterium]|nr:MAG: response regulator transcription factor [Chitinophagaceae bacterium]
MKTVLIVDDEFDARLLIREYLQPFTQFEIIGESENGFDAVQKINGLKPDLVFLDIRMPGLTGLQVIQQLVHIPQIIFTTAYDQYALKAFDTNAIDYLLKPYTSDRFLRAVTKAGSYTNDDFNRTRKVADEQLKAGPSQILVESGKKLVNVNVDDIVYLEAEKDYTWLHTESKSYLSNYGIGVLEQRLNNNYLLRIHRSFMINIRWIKEVHRDGYSVQVLLVNNKSLSVSRSYMEGLKKLFY